MATYFDKILEKRGLDECPLPLWKLKITDEEYDELKNYLRQLIAHSSLNCDNPFIARTRDCALFYAEYWRREYYDGPHSKQSVYDALEYPYYSPDNYEHLYQSALRGAKRLKIELYSDEGRTQWVDSMFYQGGLPMKLVTDGKPNSIWDNFVRGLVNRNVNFEDLNLGIVASNSNSLKGFCDQIITALDAKQFMLMPFHCDNELNSWYAYLQELKEEESHRQRLSRPFSLDWEFRIDAVEKKIYPKFVVTGRQRLPQSFIDENNITNPNFYSAQVKVNGKVVDTFDYVHNFCRYAVISKHSYHNGDAISLFVGDDTTPIITDDLDMTVPHLLYKNNEGKYELGNRIGRQDSFLLIPEGWNIGDIHELPVDKYECEGITYDGIKIPADFTDDVTIKSDDGILTFGCNTPLYWTELSSIPVYAPDITETLYDASKAHFSLCNDMENGIRPNRNARVEYRSKWDSEWKTEPGYGEIFARVIDCNGHFVTPVKFINIGNGVKVNVISADKETCKIQVAWEHGRVTTTDGVKRVNDVWEVNKDDITNNKIHFTFIPGGNSNNHFDINVKAPFKEFTILDIEGNAITSDCWIPYSDIDKFQYHLIGQNIREFTYGGHYRQLKWIGEKLYIEENDKIVKSIPYEGSLLSLFESREELRLLLGRTSQNMLRAEVNVKFLTQDGQELLFAIKDSPFRPWQKDGKIFITSKDRKVIDFKGKLKLLKLDDPSMEAETLAYDDEKGYVLPEVIRSWGNTLLTGRTRGRIRPILVDLTQELTGEQRWAIRENTIRQITEGLESSSLGDELWQHIIGWFRRTQDDDIPASSLLELHCVAKNPSALMCLAFQLFAQCNNEEDSDTLKEQLKSFSADLAFSWYWLAPHLKFVMMTINRFVHDTNNNVLRTIYIKWAMRQGERKIEYLGKLNKEDEYAEVIGKCIIKTLDMFDVWMKKLCTDSLVETYDYQTDEFTASIAEDIVYHPEKLCTVDDSYCDYIDVSQDYINEETSMFFNKFREKGKVGNEDWMWKRVNAVAAHLKGTIDLFEKSDEIRRSVIFCRKSCNKQFVICLCKKLREK